MKLEIHIVQNFAPSNLNRDDTGSPKDCELGGVRRARISSQCWKRSIRETFEKHNLVPEAERAARTKRLVEQVGARVAEKSKAAPERASQAVIKALESVGLKADEVTGKTQYLLFVPVRALDALAEVVVDHIDALAPAAAGATADAGKDDKAKTKKAKKEKADGKDAADPEVKKKVDEILGSASRTPELALFGRMIADQPSWNVEAACQVAHAFSTNRVAVEFDFYTAVDDLKRNDAAGSDMMGTIAFNSSCFYRYLVVDTAELVKNLGGDEAAKEQAKATVRALIEAAIHAIPTGKQNSMAAQNKPSLVLTVVRDGADARSLANAFVEPVRPGRDGDLVTQSTLRLAKYANALESVYGSKDRKDLSFIALDPDAMIAKPFADALPGAQNRQTLESLVTHASSAAFGAPA